MKKKKRNTTRFNRKRFTRSTHFLIREDSSGLNSPASVPSDYKYDSNNDSNDSFSAVIGSIIQSISSNSIGLFPFSLSDNEDLETKTKDIYIGSEFKEIGINKNKELTEEDQIAKDLTKLKLFN